MLEIIKYLFIEMNSIYFFIKLIRKNITKRRLVLGIIYSLLIAFAAKWTRMYMPSLTAIFLVISTMGYMAFFYKINIRFLIISSVISVASCYGAYTLLTLIFGTLFFLLKFLESYLIRDFISNITIGIFGLASSYIFFHNKRFRNGIPSLSQRKSNIPVLLLSIGILIFASLATPNIKPDWIWLVPVFLLILCVFLLYLWWQIRIKNEYIKRIREREYTVMQSELREKEKEIQKLKTYNDMLASIIHRDNKLIPAMESAVKEYLLMVDENGENIKEKAKLLLEQLKKITSERMEVLREYEKQDTGLPTTNILFIDILLSYLYRKATVAQILLTFSYSGNIENFINDYISEMDLQTLIADLVENAIIATQLCMVRNVHVDMDLKLNIPVIHFYDSGILFTTNTLLNIGLRRVTMRQDQGGTGIGLMSTFTILKKYEASFEIEEFDDGEYTKRISLCFDRKSEYRIKSRREGELTDTSKRIDLIRAPYQDERVLK